MELKGGKKMSKWKKVLVTGISDREFPYTLCDKKFYLQINGGIIRFKSTRKSYEPISGRCTFDLRYAPSDKASYKVTKKAITAVLETANYELTNNFINYMTAYTINSHSIVLDIYCIDNRPKHVNIHWCDSKII